ncbi:MAG: hypothetical protein LBO72_08220 [Helicobacteraceae bacterium]|nr:hypothetical protein [Helicobacteraceae bacterium]
MKEANLTLLLIAVGAMLIVTVVVILWQLKSRFGLKQEPQESTKTSDRVQTPIKTAKSEAPKRRESGELIVAGKRFTFEYEKAREGEAKRALELIKTSLALLKESKYADIVSSRARECETLIKKLKGVTSLDEIAIGEIVERFREYAENLSNSLD